MTSLGSYQESICSLKYRKKQTRFLCSLKNSIEVLHGIEKKIQYVAYKISYGKALNYIKIHKKMKIIYPTYVFHVLSV